MASTAACVTLLLLALLAAVQLVQSHGHHGTKPARAIPDRPGVAARFNYPADKGGARRIVGAERLGRIRKRSNVRASVGEIASLLTSAPDLGLDEGSDRLVYRCQGLIVDEPAAQEMDAIEAAEVAAAAAATAAAAGSDEGVSAAAAAGSPGTALSEVATGVAVSVSDPALGVLTRNQVFALSSRPGAVKKIYLDFDGHVTNGTRWNEAWRKGSIVTPPYNIDGNPNAFSFQEVLDIYTIWRGVAEDFAMMDVDVTTAPPESGYGANVADYIRVVIGGAAADWLGGAAGGIAYLGSFGDAVFGPAFVFQFDLKSKPKAIWEAASHEVGHTLGLLHDGAVGVTEYYGGSDNSNFAPIMGVGYYKSVTQWSKGEYPGANNKQDDLAVMSSHPNGPRMLASTFGSSTATATPLPPPAAGTARGAAQSRSISGVISASGATDMFSFYADAGAFSFNAVGVAPSPAGAARTNVDLQVTLTNAAGAVIASSNDAASMSASAAGRLPASGAYFLSVTGAGLGDPASGGYSNYGSLGQYSVALTFAAFPPNIGNTDAPITPSPSPSPEPVMPSPVPSPVLPQPSPVPLPSPSPSPVPSPSPSPLPSPVPSPRPAIPTIKVASFSVRRVNSGGSIRCVANVRIVDGTGAPVTFAGIQGTWSSNAAGAATTPFSVTSESNGAFGMTSPAMPRTAGSGCTYTITGTTKAGFVLDARTSYGMSGTLTW